MADIGTKKFAEMYGVKQSLVQSWCRKKLINGATQDGKGHPWHIPSKAKAPFGYKKIK